jgi:regulator of sirC expression with transglutaminase-like and TPR domain
MGLAETYRTQGKKAEAIRYYERYLEVRPNGPDAPVARSAIQRLKE